MKRKTLYALIIVLLVLEATMICGCIEEETTSKQSGQPKIIIIDYNISIYDVGVDAFYIDDVNVLLKNEGSTSINIDKIILSSEKGKIEDDALGGSLSYGEEKEFSISALVFYYTLEKKIGINEVKGKISVISSSGKVIAERNITIPIPRAQIGDTIPEVGTSISKHNLSLTLLWWKESDIAVDGPYSENDYYTFTSKQGMKFLILAYKFQNNWNREQSTPYLSAGEIATDKEYIYTSWDPPHGINSEEYNPRESTDEEVNELVGDSGGYENLLPEESVKGCIVFEIPEDQTPIEASIAYVYTLINLEKE